MPRKLEIDITGTVLAVQVTHVQDSQWRWQLAAIEGDPNVKPPYRATWGGVVCNPDAAFKAGMLARQAVLNGDEP